jgi:hypothetical protein
LYKEEHMSMPTFDVWHVQEADFPTHGKPAEQLRFLLNYAVMAPSGHNTQPWLFQIDGNEVELYADRTRALPMADPEDRELILSCGAALFHLRMAFRYFGYQGVVTVFPTGGNQDLLARVELGGRRDSAAEERRLFQAIPLRRTNRARFEDKPIPPALLAGLQAAANAEGAWLQMEPGEAARNAVTDLIAEGDRLQWADRRFRRELAIWVHPNRSTSGDGMPGYAFGLSELTSDYAPVLLRTFDLGNGRAAKDRELATGSPVLAVLGTNGDTPQDWLCAGQALARVLLRARAEGVWASYLNQPIEVAEQQHNCRSPHFDIHIDPKFVL